MKFISIAIAYALVVGTAAVAQDAPKADLFLGYSFLRANSARNIPAFTNNGGLGTFGWNFNPHIALEAEFGGYHNGNIHNIEFDTTEMTYLFGPRFSLSRARRVIPYVHTLFGGIHFTTSLPVTLVPTPTSTTATTTRIGASQDAFAMALGGGLDIKLTHYMMLRPIQLDYMMTRLEDFGQSGTPSQNRNQHNLRFAAGFTFTFGGERPSPPTTTAVALPTLPRTKQCADGNAIPIDQDCPKQSVRLTIQANPTQVCQGSTASVTTSGQLPEGANVQWSINGEPVSQAPKLEFGATGRDPGAYKIGLKVTAKDYNDASAETTIAVLGYTPPSGTVSVSPSEILLGEKATLTANFTPGQCGGALKPVTYSAAEGTITGNQFDSASVQLAPPTSSEQRRTITLMAMASDERGSGSAQTSVVVKQPAALAARQLPDVLFAQGSDRVNNCGKRVLLEELRRLTDSDPQGRVVIVGHIEGTESVSQSLDMKRALNAAAVISAGQGVCTSFPASQILVNAVGTAEDGVAYRPNFCAGSTAVAERPGQTVASTDDAAKSRRVEVWFVPAGGTLPPSGASAKGASTLGVNSLGCPQ
jgi:outer membrane protein OmpA-like peptidoglycan-associated protein